MEDRSGRGGPDSLRGGRRCPQARRVLRRTPPPWRRRRVPGRLGQDPIRVGDDSATLGPGGIAFIPRDTLHGFHRLEEAQFEVFGEQRMGEWVLVLGADGSRREVEVWVEGLPWDRPLPPGRAHTTLDELWSYFATTRHLVIMDQEIAAPDSPSP